MAKKISMRSGATALPEESMGYMGISLILQSGVEDLDNDFVVSENNPQNLSVNVSSGRAFFVKTGMTYHGYSTATENLSINVNSSGNDRIDAVVLYVDLSTAPNTDASNILKLLVVQGTPAATPQAPTDSEIQLSIGAGNPFIRLANVYVSNGASVITNANITDTRTPAYMKYKAGIYQMKIYGSELGGNWNSFIQQNVSGSVSLDADKTSVFRFTLTGDTTLLEPTNMKNGQGIEIHIKQDGTGGRSLTWWNNIKWPDGVEPVLTTTANKTDVFLIRKVASNEYLGFVMGQNL